MLHKGRSSVVITEDELKTLVRVCKVTVDALVQDLMETDTAEKRPSEKP